MRILITGGSGFIGSNFIHHLINNTEYELLNVDKLSYASNPLSLEKITTNNKYNFEKLDICNGAALEKVLMDFKPTSIVHFAAESHVDKSISDPSNFISSNILGTYSLLKSTLAYFNNLKENKKFRLVHVSTDEVFGDLNKPGIFSTEDSSYNPSSPYSASKAASDHLVSAWIRTFNLPAIITHCSNNYGPFQHQEKLIPNSIQRALSGFKIPIYGDGRQLRDWLFVEDHIEALHLILEQGLIKDCYNIGGGNQIENIEVVKKIISLVQRKTFKEKINDDLIDFVEDRPGHDVCYGLDSKKIKTELGWQAMESFDSGLEKTVDWYLNNLDWLKPIN